MAELKHILDGYKVLDFTQVLAGPTVTRLMAEMGAEILKVELAPNGEISRGLPYLRNGRSAYFIQQNRGKKSLCIDARHAKGLAILKQLVKQVDVLVENFAPGVIGRLGLDYGSVKALNPKIVMCSISAFGQSGPLSHLPGYDYIAQAYSGITSMIGEKDGQPYFPLPGIGDVSTGVHATAAINGALLYRERTGQGQYVDIALLDAYFHCHELNVQMYSASGGDIKPTRSGTQHYAVCPSGLYKGRETYLFIMALPHQWPSVCKAIGRPDLVPTTRALSITRRGCKTPRPWSGFWKTGSPRCPATRPPCARLRRPASRSRRCCRLSRPSTIRTCVSVRPSARSPTGRLASSRFRACRSDFLPSPTRCRSKRPFWENITPRF